MTNIYPEHLDHYNGFGGYVAAKMNIIRHQKGSDYFICNAEQDFDRYFDFSNSKTSVIKVGLNGSNGDEDIIAAASAHGKAHYESQKQG